MVEGQDKIAQAAARLMDQIDADWDEEGSTLKIDKVCIIVRLERFEDNEVDEPAESFPMQFHKPLYSSEILGLLESAKLQLVRNSIREDDEEE